MYKSSCIYFNHAVQNEIKVVLKGGELCINIESEFSMYAFWPRNIGSAENCYCRIFTISNCYCTQLQLSEYTVLFNQTTAEICWKNLTLAMNGTVVGTTNEESVNCGDQMYSIVRTYLRMIVILVEEIMPSSVSSSDIGKSL